MTSATMPMREIRYQWVQFMCMAGGADKARQYEDEFDRMLDQHNREVAASTLGRAKVMLDLENLASVLFTASDGIPSIGMNTNERAKEKVLKGLDDLMKQYLRGPG